MEATWNAQIELDLEADAQRRVRRALGFSALGHVLVVVVLMFKPAPEPVLLPAAITVDLVAAPPAVAKPAAKPAPVAKPRPAPPPPPPQAKILPKRAPDALAKPVAKPAPVEPIRRRTRPKEMELGDAMAALRNQLGEPADAPPVEVADAAPSAALPGAVDAAGTATLSPELRQWVADTIRHVRRGWVISPEFLGRGLMTELRVQLLADGTVVGSPEVIGSSGDPYADDNAVRTILKASPLPPPPAAGAQVFIFSPEAIAR